MNHRLPIVLLLAAATVPSPLPAAPPDGFPLPAGAVHRFGNRQLRHPDGIHSTLVSPDGKLLATIGNSTIIVWDLQTLRARSVFRQQRSAGVMPDPGGGRIVFTADSRSLLVVFPPSSSGSRLPESSMPTVDVATLYDLDTGKPRLTLKGSHDYWTAGWLTAGGKEFAVASRRDVRFFDVRDGKELKKVPLAQPTSGVTRLAPRADRIVTTPQRGGPGSVQVFDARTGNEVFAQGIEGHPIAACIHPDGKRLAIHDMSGKVRLYDVETKKEILAFSHPADKQRGPMQFSGDGQTLYFGGQHGQLYRWDLKNNKPLPDVGRHSTWTLSSFCLSPDESTLYSVGHDKLVRRWDLKSGKQLPLPEGYLTQTAVVPTRDGKYLLVADHGGALDLWDLGTGKREKVIQSAVGMHGMDCVAVSDDGRWFAGGRTVQDVRLYDLKAGKEERVIPLVEKPDAKGSDHVKRVEFGPGGKVLYTSSGQTGTTAWEIPSGKQLWRAAGGIYMSVDPQGRWIVTGGVSGSEQLRWALLDAATGQVIRLVDVPIPEVSPGTAGGGYPPILTDLRFTPDGLRVISAHYDGSIRIWDPETGKLIAVLEDRFHGPTAVACSPDSRWVAVGRSDGTITLWELATGKSFLTRTGHDSMVRDVVFTRDGRGVIGNADLAPILWNLEPKDPFTVAGDDALWTELATADAAKAYRLQWGLIRDPGKAVVLFTDRVKPAELAIARTDFDRWVANLDHPQFRTREAAEKELTKAGSRVPQSWLQKALADARSDELRVRLGRIRTARDRPQPDEWRFGRAIQVLERAGTAEAITLLRSWSTAPEGTPAAIAARAALERMGQR